MEALEHKIRTVDNVSIAFNYYHDAGRDSVVVVCPGFFQNKDTATFKQMSAVLAQHTDVITMDFRGHGRSTGLFTFSAREGADLKAVLGWARQRYTRVGVLGFSLGAATAINVLACENHVASLVAVSAPSSFEKIEFKFWTADAIWTGFQSVRLGGGVRPGNPWLRKESPLSHIKDIVPTPVLFIHGTRDSIVSHHHSERLYHAAVEPKRLEIIEGGWHAEWLFRREPERFMDIVLSWFADTMEGMRHVS